MTGILFILFSIPIYFISNGQNTKQIHWQEYNPEILIQSKLNQKTLIIDFVADWCIPCKELDKFTFRDEKVKTELQKYITLKADLTLLDKKDHLQKEYQIKGIPTIIFLKPDGQEIRELRLVGFENAEKFYLRLKRLESIISADLSE